MIAKTGLYCLPADRLSRTGSDACHAEGRCNQLVGPIVRSLQASAKMLMFTIDFDQPAVYFVPFSSSDLDTAIRRLHKGEAADAAGSRRKPGAHFQISLDSTDSISITRPRFSYAKTSKYSIALVQPT